MKKKIEEISVDVLSHFLVPEMSVLTNSEKKKVLIEYGISETQLPKIKSSDPAVLALKAQSGDILKIKRNDGTGAYTAYRIVIES